MNEKLKILIYILALASIILITTSVFTWFSRPIEVKELDVRFIVGKNPGFDLNSSALTFGKVTKGGSAVRGVTINNEYDFPIEVKVLMTEEIVKFFSVPSDVYIEPDKNSSFSVTLSVPEDLDFMEYSGKIRFFIFKKR